MPQTTGAVSGAAATVSIYVSAAYVDISGSSQSIDVVTASVVTGDAYTFDGNFGIITVGKYEPVEADESDIFNLGDNSDDDSERKYAIIGLSNTKNRKGDRNLSLVYNNGKLDGVQRTYFSNGKIRKISTYKDGLAEGAQITYNAAGLKESELSFKAGKKNGTWNYYFDSGKIARTEDWKDGKKNGVFVSYDELGKVLSTEKYAADLPVGLHQTFYADGKLNYSCTYTNKGEKVEEFVVDEYGVKKQLFPKTNEQE